MNTFLPAPSLENMDGIGCAAVADFELCEPFRWLGNEITGEDQARFYQLVSFDPATSVATPTAEPRYMVVEAENRDMLLDEPCNEMMVCRDNS